MSLFETIDQSKFGVLRRADRIWAVGAIHGQAERLRALHDGIGERFESGDRVVYLGDYLGYGDGIRATLDELLRFRRLVLAQPPFAHPDDVIFLRGSQEEMWRKLLQLQFAAEPRDVLAWVLKRGVDATLAAYGGDAGQATRSINESLVAISRWTAGLRNAVKAAPGHFDLLSRLRRAAVTEDGGLLFVNTGLDAERPLEMQGDRFWWDSAGFDRIDAGYGEFKLVVRGYDPEMRGVVAGAGKLGIDSGCRVDGPLNAVCLSPDGEVLNSVQA
jgi:serine/threonine protein phosphatase 1